MSDLKTHWSYEANTFCVGSKMAWLFMELSLEQCTMSFMGTKNGWFAQVKICTKKSQNFHVEQRSWHRATSILSFQQQNPHLLSCSKCLQSENGSSFIVSLSVIVLFGALFLSPHIKGLQDFRFKLK